MAISSINLTDILVDMRDKHGFTQAEIAQNISNTVEVTPATICRLQSGKTHKTSWDLGASIVDLHELIKKGKVKALNKKRGRKKGTKNSPEALLRNKLRPKKPKTPKGETNVASPTTPSDLKDAVIKVTDANTEVTDAEVEVEVTTDIPSEPVSE